MVSVHILLWQISRLLHNHRKAHAQTRLGTPLHLAWNVLVASQCALAESSLSLEGCRLESHSCCQDVLDSGSVTEQKVINKIKASQRNGGLKMQDRNFI